jgi:hypothetical protein
VHWTCSEESQFKITYVARSLQSKLSDGKYISGKGRLTDKWINSLQNYYGLAIRQNTDNLYGMKKAVAAVLFHCAQSENLEQQHLFCPRKIHGVGIIQIGKITSQNYVFQKL